MRRAKLTLASSLVVTYLLTNMSFGAKIEFRGELVFEQNQKWDIIPRSLCVTEDGIYLIPHYKKKIIKTYHQRENKFLSPQKSFGVLGYQNSQTPWPTFKLPGSVIYDRSSGILCVADVPHRRDEKKVYIFNKINDNSFRISNEIPGVDAFDLAYWPDKKSLIVSGWTKKNGMDYSLYSVDMDGVKKAMLLKSHEKYGYRNFDLYDKAYKSYKIPALGVQAYIDIQIGPEQTTSIFFVYEAAMRITRINLDNPGEKFEFGDKTKHYIEPEATDYLVKCRKNGLDGELLVERAKTSYIKDIWATQDHIFILYDGANNSESNYRLQMYSNKGILISDLAIPGTPYEKMWLDKKTYRFFALSKKSRYDDLKILEYQIVE